MPEIIDPHGAENGSYFVKLMECNQPNLANVSPSEVPVILTVPATFYSIFS